MARSRYGGCWRGPPHGSLLLIIGGSPCQELTTAGARRGRLGLGGSHSILFYAIPATASVAAQLRPDLA
eukprot:10698866-Lingulodinium_polyedra.AAC.1